MAMHVTQPSPGRGSSALSMWVATGKGRAWQCPCGWKNRPSNMVCGGGNAGFGCGAPPPAELQQAKGKAVTVATTPQQLGMLQGSIFGEGPGIVARKGSKGPSADKGKEKA